ncbi:TetR/AcrR family transcriptional regulator [Micromonospora sp. CPCC 205546]|uniref:TetR/AcrR family transcriptional regulator n=1 Tax=Micromonospora sp. CPCC 205546 TaxID=3122397 RepID=UPI002FEF75B0
MARTGPAQRKPDPRAESTRRQLAAAVLDLASQRDLSLITVSDIANRAGVNRATVYLHSADRDSLLVGALESWMSRIAELAARCCPSRPGMDVTAAPDELVGLFREFEQDAALFRRILGADGSGKLVHRLQNVVREHVRRHLPEQEEPGGVPHDLRAAFLSGALLGVVGHWLSQDTRPPAVEVADSTWKMINSLS